MSAPASTASASDDTPSGDVELHEDLDVTMAGDSAVVRSPSTTVVIVGVDEGPIDDLCAHLADEAVDVVLARGTGTRSATNLDRVLDAVDLDGEALSVFYPDARPPRDVYSVGGLLDNVTAVHERVRAVVSALLRADEDDDDTSAAREAAGAFAEVLEAHGVPGHPLAAGGSIRRGDLWITGWAGQADEVVPEVRLIEDES